MATVDEIEETDLQATHKKYFSKDTTNSDNRQSIRF